MILDVLLEFPSIRLSHTSQNKECYYASEDGSNIESKNSEDDIRLVAIKDNNPISEERA